MSQLDEQQEEHDGGMETAPVELQSLGDWEKSHDCNSLGRSQVDARVSLMDGCSAAETMGGSYSRICVTGKGSPRWFSIHSTALRPMTAPMLCEASM